MIRPPRTPPLRAALVGTGLLASTGFVAPAAAAVTVVQAESLKIPSSKGGPFVDARAQGASALLLRRKTAVTAELDGKLERVTLRVRADACRGFPKLRVRVDGKMLGRRTIRRGRWSQVRFRVTKPTAGGTHRVSVGFVNPRRTKRCTRALRLDWISSVGTPSATNGGASAPAPTIAPIVTASSEAAPVAPTPTASGVTRLYVDPISSPAKQADAWRSSRPSDAALLDKIAGHSRATWLGNYSGDFQTLDRVLNGAAADKSRAVFAIYAIPGRDGGQYSAGGHPNAAAYRAWIDAIAARIRDRPTIVIVEPDALAASIDPTKVGERHALIAYAAAKLGALPDTKVYLDAGNSSWQTPAVMIPRLQAAGVASADGIALNVSNFRATDDEIAWGRTVTSALGGKSMVIDTSRNGNGPLPGATGEASWCNPPGRALGLRPTMATNVPGVDAFLWVKVAGESDGSCRGLPTAGVFMPQAALEMARGAAW